jgi:hypothetical protein
MRSILTDHNSPLERDSRQSVAKRVLIAADRRESRRWTSRGWPHSGRSPRIEHAARSTQHAASSKQQAARSMKRTGTQSGRTARPTTLAGIGRPRDLRGRRRSPRSAAACPPRGSALALWPRDLQPDARSHAQRATRPPRARRGPSPGRLLALRGSRLLRQPPRRPSRDPQVSRRRPQVQRR